MPKLVVIPTDNLDDDLIFKSTVLNKVNLDDIEPILFIRLYELLKNNHRDNYFSIWGVPSGIKSSDANKWNKISENDLVVFTKDNSFIGFSRIKTKFQSESIAHKLWPQLQNTNVRPYLLTLETFNTVDENLTNNLNRISRKGKFKLDQFEIIDNKISSEFTDALELIESKFVPNLPSQGFGLSALEKKIIEKHAVKLATEHLFNIGYTEIEDTGDFESFDIYAKGPAGELSVEVKGTTGIGNVVILTKNEVSFQKAAYPNNGLFVASNIELVREEIVFARGGDIKFVSPWFITDENLKPISFEYKV
jgi:hypothetical protein